MPKFPMKHFEIFPMSLFSRWVQETLVSSQLYHLRFSSEHAEQLHTKQAFSWLMVYTANTKDPVGNNMAISPMVFE